jgi:hypothetical protein
MGAPSGNGTPSTGAAGGTATPTRGNPNADVRTIFPLTIQSPTITLRPTARDISIQVSCSPQQSGDCHGEIILRIEGNAPSPKRRAAASRCARGCRVLGRAGFVVQAGHSKQVKVHLAHSAGSLFRRRKMIKVRATVRLSDAAGHSRTRTSTLTLKRAP